jgi:dTMP kinase
VSLDRFEQEHGEFFERVRQAYLARAAKTPQRFAVIHAEKTMSEVKQDLAKIVASL